MRVLIHRSHCSSTRRDGWSGAPGEAAWVRELVPYIQAECAARGIETVVVDGDYDPVNDTDHTYGSRHPEFAEDYAAFIAPHYDADIYGSGGGFWGRAATSATYQLDDALGTVVWSRLCAIPDAPASHFERLNANVTGYYAFRLTTARTPGILVEHGVGWGADKLWLRDHMRDIARVWAESLAIFGGIQEDDMDEATVKRIVREVLGEDGYPNFVQAVNDRLAIDAHHGHHVTFKVQDADIYANVSEPKENPQ